ncbi:TPM domain-containing protein [Bifidobacterium simiarum]|uniref:TPM domain-containing protein n=1 Tax=Bifidobacterium simiarum TaxID=2045441 RepID=UPI001BDD747E|nr:TPM domain-containing protein [Bifidobacterium simiarum]
MWITSLANTRLGMIASLFTVLCLILACMASPQAAWAADPKSTPSASSSASAGSSATEKMTITEDITDTENLLGDNLGKVMDAIKTTKSETGVRVKLLFIPNFIEGEDPQKWAARVLKSTDPDPNTVMLAVASEQGNLVVAVSSNSDEWLSSQKTVDELSSAALSPLTENDTPDWSGSAIAMMDQIKTLKKTSTSSSVTSLGVWIFVGCLVLLAVAAVAFRLIKGRGQHAHADRQLARRQRRRARKQDDGNGSAGNDDSAGNDGDKTADADKADDHSADDHDADGSPKSGSGNEGRSIFMPPAPPAK